MINLHHSHIQCDDCGKRHTPGNPTECIEVLKDALADKEVAVKEWQDIAGQWEDKGQKLTEQIAALTAELKSLTEAYNNTDWKKKNDEQKEAINKIVVTWGKKIRQLTAENKRLEKVLEQIADILPFTHEDAITMQGIAKDALQREGGH